MNRTTAVQNGSLARHMLVRAIIEGPWCNRAKKNKAQWALV